MLSSQILTTKLFPPPPRRNHVVRPRLVERLNAGIQDGRRVLLVSAAAGFGKTTLVSAWITEEQLRPSVAWVSLDEGDNDPIRFLAYLIAALQQVHTEIGADVLPVLQSPQPAPWTELVVQLINQIAFMGKPVVLVLDDYHLITAPAVHQAAMMLIEHQPNHMHTVIITREDPPLPLPKMRVRGQVTEIRERDLRFTLPEAEAFLVEAMGLTLSSVEVAKLKERTEGWAAGMQLAALALEEYASEPERRAFIDAFTGSDRYIVDYLISEVLERQSEATRQFLLHTSVLERFCGALCDQVVYGGNGISASQSILQSLDQGNMFLVPLDNQREWFRYHHLFAEMLLHTLRRSAPDQIAGLYRRASAWFEAKGLATEAIQYALAYAVADGDWAFAGRLLGRYAMRMLLQGQTSLVIRWCQTLPKPYLERAPEICIYYAWALVLTFRNDFLDAVEEKIQLAERAIDLPELPAQATVGQDGALVPFRDWVVGHICVIRSQILLGRFGAYVDPQELIALSLKGLELLPEAEKGIRSTCKINLAHAQLMQNRPVEAQRAFEEALPFQLEASNYLGGVTNIFYQVRLAYYLGQLDRAEALCREWKEKFAEMAGPARNEIPAIRGLDIVLSILLLEHGYFEEVERLLVQALDLPGWASWMELLGFIALARVRFLRGDISAAEETLLRMAQMGPQHERCAEALHILFALKQTPQNAQVRAQAESWVKTANPDPNVPFALGIGPYHCDVEYFCHLAWAEIQISLGHPRRALEFIGPALASAKEHGLTFRVLELTLANAQADEALGNTAAALARLGQALEIAETYGYSRVFAEIPNLEPLLRQAIERKIHPAYAGHLLASLGQVTAWRQTIGQEAKPHDAEGPGMAVLIEPLSERELEVLRLIARGFSNDQIAKHLVIAQGTVKRHITNLYGKLAVESRTQAIAKARELGLIP